MNEQMFSSYLSEIMKNQFPKPRESFKSLLKLKEGQDLIGAEIGVFEGINAKAILNAYPHIKLYLVDNYERVVIATGGALVPEYQKQEIMRNCERNLSCYNGRVIRVFKQSEVAYKDFLDNYFDYVYIDGEHLYDWVKRDIELWYPKVKIGGILAGHDYEMSSVMRAVAEFRDMNNIKYFSFSTGNGESDWWFTKV